MSDEPEVPESEINFGTERNRRRYEAMTPEQQRTYRQHLAENNTPEARAEKARLRELAEKDVPPLVADDPLLELVATFRQQRERLGLSLADVSRTTELDVSTVSRLELGKIPNPTYVTLRAIARALGMSIQVVATVDR